MANWHTYSRFIKTAAGMLITVAGVTTIGIYIRGQHLAEIVGGYTERSRIAFLRDPQTPSTTSVYISSHLRFDKLYDAMVGARFLATNDYTFVGGGIFWKSSYMEDGYSAANATVEWYAETNAYSPLVGGKVINWKRRDPTNIIELAETTASYMRDKTEICVPLPGVTNRIPLAAEIYGNGAHPEYGIADQELFDGTNNWWWTIGIHTNIYQYSLGEYNNVYDLVKIYTEYSTGFTIDKSFVKVAWDNFPRDVTFENSAPVTARHQAGVYRLECNNREDAYILVYSTGDPILYEFDSDIAYITEAATNQTAFKMRMTTAPIYPAEYNIINKTLNTIDSVSPSSLIFSNSNYNVWQDIFVNTGVRTSATDRAGIVGAGADFIPIVIYSSSTNEAVDIKVDQLATETEKAGINSTAISMYTGMAESNVTFVTSKHIRTNNLIQAKIVLGNLTETYCLYTSGLGNMDYTSTVAYVRGASTNLDTKLNDGFYSTSEIVSLNNSNYSKTNTNWSTYLFYLRAWGTVNSYESFDDGPPFRQSTMSELYASLSSTYRHYFGCSFDYPSTWAITNGYVNSFQVYAIYVCATGEALTTYKNAWYDVLQSWDADDTYPDYYEDKLYGITTDVRHRPDNPPMVWFPPLGTWGGTNTYTTVDRRTLDLNVDTYVDSPLVLIADVDCSVATERPLFDIDPTRITSLNLAGGDYQQQGMIYYTGTKVYPAKYVERSDYILYYSQKIDIQKFLIVVDWNWDHCNLIDPYDPTPYTPDWMTSNTNSP